MIYLKLGRVKCGNGAVGNCWRSGSSLNLGVQSWGLMGSGFMKLASAASLRVNTALLPSGFWFGAHRQDF